MVFCIFVWHCVGHWPSNMSPLLITTTNNKEKHRKMLSLVKQNMRSLTLVIFAENVLHKMLEHLMGIAKLSSKRQIQSKLNWVSFILDSSHQPTPTHNTRKSSDLAGIQQNFCSNIDRFSHLTSKLILKNWGRLPT